MTTDVNPYEVRYNKVIPEHDVIPVPEVFGGKCKGCFEKPTPATRCGLKCGSVCASRKTIFIHNTEEARAEYHRIRALAALGVEKGWEL